MIRAMHQAEHGARLFKRRSRRPGVWRTSAGTVFGGGTVTPMFGHRRLSIDLRGLAVAVVAATAVVGLAGGCARVPGIYVYENAEAASRANPTFDAVSYVGDIWSSRVLPTVQEKAVDAPTLLAELKSDPAAAGQKYGRQAAAGGPYSYLIKGTGTVTKVSDAPTGPVTVEIDTPTGKQEIAITTGPVIAGTALRDAVGFIDFSQFTNQLEYADVATQLNDKVRSEVVGKVDKGTLVGKQVTFAGAFTALGPNAVLVVPTELTVAS
jgi:predicted lipoprotein